MRAAHDHRAHQAALPTPSDPLRHPTDDHPRWRLRVFDRRWPWRATRGEALRDALLSRNAMRESGGAIFLDACAAIQRDPPFYSDMLAVRRRRAARAMQEDGGAL